MRTIYKKPFGNRLYPSTLSVEGLDDNRGVVVRVSGRTDGVCATVVSGRLVEGNVVLTRDEAKTMAYQLLAWLRGDDDGIGAVMPVPKSPIGPDEVHVVPTLELELHTNDNRVGKTLELIA